MRSRWLGFVVAALALGFSIWAFPRLPASVVSHWNLRGEPDGYSPRWLAAILAPALILGIRLLATLFPRIDPRSPNYEKFGGTYWLLINSILLFAAGLHVVMVGYALGWPVSINRVMPVGVGLLFVIIGNYLGRVEPNWFMGVRTPWTLSSDKVWRTTNRTAGWMLVGAGVLSMAAAFLPSVAVGPLLGVTAGTVAVTAMVQSYVLWKREQSANH
jgi:uncharacterized membrane protein